MTDLLPPWDDEATAAQRATWKSLRHQVVFENPWIRIESHDVVAPTGRECHYGLVRFANRAVGVLPLFDDGTVALVGQARFALGTFSWEMPEGGVPEGEDTLDGAKRELREETGYRADTWQEILRFDMSNSVTDEVAVLYLATGLKPGDVEPDETENLFAARVPFSQLLKAVIMGQVRDGLTVASVLRVHHMAVSGELPPHLAEAVLR
ncbi:DNA mismatch repair protein MutT [Asticcacaulis sp. AC460]|uniref:NUDIX domain-containing protein n=1 Tax=Asticcacaulis sp. AC460 TaxID=1282360 RepID=UPI0003C3DDDC|nr:NUDIX hydrolase [Asticcacaulis sp. AC460]ESQ87002.1 DNA mismatch repair protein MutT [Asticcacaulis sp. AC460]